VFTKEYPQQEESETLKSTDTLCEAGSIPKFYKMWFRPKGPQAESPFIGPYPPAVYTDRLMFSRFQIWTLG